MKSNVIRNIIKDLQERLECNPVVALLGPRQCGKTTLAKQLLKIAPDGVYLDLENPDDLTKLSVPLAFFRANSDKLVVIDEIQLQPELFAPLRSYIDSVNRECQILILGSASRELIKQGSESLAGRISFLELTPFLLEEVPAIGQQDMWERGGFPLSLLAKKEKQSNMWREDYLRALIERDLPLLGLPASPVQTRRLLSMLAHNHGELHNAQKLGGALGIAGKTVNHYIEYLEGAFLIRKLLPYEINLKKRLVKSPKIYYRDTGLLHSILRISTFNDLLGHPVFGASWEGFAIEQILSAIGTEWEASFYRTQVGAEIDLILERGETRIALEFKATTAPTVTRGFWTSLEDLSIPTKDSWIVCPIDEQFPYRNDVMVGGVRQVIEYLKTL